MAGQASALSRDFLNSTMLGSGSLLLESLTPKQLLAREDWTGYGGVGDYADSNGNTFEVMSAGHQAALFLNKEGGSGLKCLVLDNHPIFGGEAKRNEFIVDGKRLMAPQGSDHFQVPFPHSFIARFYDLIGLDWREFKYQTWNSSSPEIPLGRSFEGPNLPTGFYFGSKFGQRPGMRLIDPWVKRLQGAPISDSMCTELLNYHGQRRKGLPFDYPGDEKSRKLDSITIENHLLQEYGLHRETIQTFMAEEGSGFGGGPDVLSAYCLYAFQSEHPLIMRVIPSRVAMRA